MVGAIQQVLDLARAGYISYDALADGPQEGTFTLNEENTAAIYTDFGFGGVNIFIVGGSDESAPAQQDPRIAFPAGERYVPLSYTLSTGFISAAAQDVEACYRWLSTISREVSINGGMPVLTSLLTGDVLVATEGEANVAFYQAIAEQLANPNTVILPSASTDINRRGPSIAEYWLNRAFDRYVLADADLFSELEQAEGLSRDYLNCIDGIPPFVVGAIKTQRHISSSLRTAHSV